MSKLCIALFISLVSAISFAKGKTDKKTDSKRETASTSYPLDSEEVMRETHHLLSVLKKSSVLPDPMDLQNTNVTLRIEQRGGGYYMSYTFKGPGVANTLNCSASGVTSIDFSTADCQRVLGN